MSVSDNIWYLCFYWNEHINQNFFYFILFLFFIIFIIKTLLF